MNTSFKLKTLASLISLGGIALACSTAQAEVGNPRVNQLGYLPNSAKIATYKTSNTSTQSWQLKQNGTPVASGQTTAFGNDAASGDYLQQIDLSNVTATGSGFTLTVGGDTSYPFAISANVYRGALYDSLRYFYHNRSGIKIDTQYTGGGNGSYAANSKWSRPAGHLNVGANKGDMNVPCWSGTCNYSLNVTKGWYDAGDHGKYVVNGGISAWTLLNMYERAQYLVTNSTSLSDGKLNIPESANGVPDILDEARWEVEFLLSMQVPTGQTKAGMVHHKMHDVGWTGFPLAPHEDDKQRALVPPSTAATLNLAAVAAQSARIWKDIDSGFAATCLTAAQRAWDAAKANPNDIYSGNFDNGGGGYGDSNVSDDFYWAAAELYITTGDSKYLSTINSYLVERIDFNWADTELLGLMSLATVPSSQTASLRSAAQQKIVSIANSHLTTQNASGYSAPLTNLGYGWGSNSGVTNNLMLMGLAYDFTKNDSFAKGVSKGVDYLFGRNTLSTSFVTGEGTKTVTQPHHRFWSGAISGSYPWAPPGALSGGPNKGLEDSTAAAQLSGCTSKPATCWIDNIGAYSVNEITINWNAPLAWVLNFENDYAKGTTPVNHTPVASFTLNTTSGYTGTSPFIVDASGSTDADGDALTYLWDFGDRGSSTNVKATHYYYAAGTYTITLTVDDGHGGVSSTSKNVSLAWDNQISSSSSSRSSVPSSSSSVPSSISSSSSSSSSQPSGAQCNWYGQIVPLCVTTQSGWGWEDSKSCVAVSTCTSQPAPYGIIGGNSSTSKSSSSSSLSSVKSSSSSSAPSSTPSSSSSSSVKSSSSSSSSSSTGASKCQYVIGNEWNTGFTATIRITNNGTNAINGWNLSWSYSDGTKLTNSWNANVSGSNPYSASDLGWNGTVQPGQSVEFGFQANKGSSASAQIPAITGSACN